MRWDQSLECQRAIERDTLAIERYKASRNPDQDMHVNDLWHARNLDLLEQCLAYVKGRQYREFEALWPVYCREESNRLGDRALLMQLHGIERLPHVYRSREHALLQEFIALLANREEEMNE